MLLLLTRAFDGSPLGLSGHTLSHRSARVALENCIEIGGVYLLGIVRVTGRVKKKTR